MQLIIEKKGIPDNSHVGDLVPFFKHLNFSDHELSLLLSESLFPGSCPGHLGEGPG